MHSQRSRLSAIFLLCCNMTELFIMNSACGATTVGVAAAVGGRGIRKVEGLENIVHRAAHDRQVHRTDRLVIVDIASPRCVGHIFAIFIREERAAVAGGQQLRIRS